MSNPTLREEVFNNNQNDLNSLSIEKSMSVQGSLFKTLILTLLLAFSASYTWYLQIAGFADKANLLMITGGIGGFIAAMVICFAPKNNMLSISTPIYALLEGLFLGGISAMFNTAYPGIVSQAVLGTILTIVGMFIVYSLNILRATETFMKVIMIATFAIAGIYILQIILSFFHIVIPQIFSNSPIGIAFSIGVCIVAALNLIMDFEFINRFNGNAPKYMEWYGAFSLMVTIVWLYLEILKLLAKLSSRR